MIDFKKGYFLNKIRINEGIVNHKNYKIYLNEDGYAVDMLGNLSNEDITEINNALEKSVKESEQNYCDSI